MAGAGKVPGPLLSYLFLPYLEGLLPLPPPEGLPVLLGALGGVPLEGLLPLPPPEGLPVLLGALGGVPPGGLFPFFDITFLLSCLN